MALQRFLGKDGANRYQKTLWDRFAYASRYGHQPLSTVMGMTLIDLRSFNDALGRIVAEENTTNH